MRNRAWNPYTPMTPARYVCYTDNMSTVQYFEQVSQTVVVMSQG